jgi:GNAT superfamily N-acetyltransferase
VIETLKPIAFWAGTHSVHYLTPDDIPQVQALFARCHEFWWISEGRGVPEDAASSTFTESPPDYDPSRLLFLGVYSPANRLVGLVTTPPDFPEERTWYIGLMVLDPDARGRRLGEAVYRAFEGWVASQGGRRILLAVVDDNPRGRKFWERMGFAPLRVVAPRLHGEKLQGMLEMERWIKAPALGG